MAVRSRRRLTSPGRGTVPGRTGGIAVFARRSNRSGARRLRPSEPSLPQTVDARSSGREGARAATNSPPLRLSTRSAWRRRPLGSAISQANEPRPDNDASTEGVRTSTAPRSAPSASRRSPSPDDVTRRPTPSNGGRVVEDYKTTLRRLALRDDRYIESLLADERGSAALSKLDPGTHALARVGALIAMDAAPPSYMNAVEAAGDAGVTHEEIVGTLIAVLQGRRSRACRLGGAEPGPGDRLRRRRRLRAARAGPSPALTRRTGGSHGSRPASSRSDDERPRPPGDARVMPAQVVAPPAHDRASRSPTCRHPRRRVRRPRRGVEPEESRCRRRPDRSARLPHLPAAPVPARDGPPRADAPSVTRSATSSTTTRTTSPSTRRR